MAVLKVSQIDKALRKKGFEKRNDRKRHIFYEFVYKGSLVGINTHVSHGANEIGDDLIGAMSEQVKINRSQFIELIRCTISQRAYEQLIHDHLKDCEGNN